MQKAAEKCSVIVDSSTFSSLHINELHKFTSIGSAYKPPTVSCQLNLSHHCSQSCLTNAPANDLLD